MEICGVGKPAWKSGKLSREVRGGGEGQVFMVDHGQSGEGGLMEEMEACGCWTRRKGWVGTKWGWEACLGEWVAVKRAEGLGLGVGVGSRVGHGQPGGGGGTVHNGGNGRMGPLWQGFGRVKMEISGVVKPAWRSGKLPKELRRGLAWGGGGGAGGGGGG